MLPVVKIDGRPVGNGAPGLIASALRRDFHRYAEIIMSVQSLGTKTRMLKKHTNLCSHAANLGLHLKQACHLMPMPQVLWPIIDMAR